MKYWPCFFVLTAFATVNEPIRWEWYSGYRNDRLHWHLQTGGSGEVNGKALYRDLQFWENALAIKIISHDLVFYLRGSYAAFGKGGTVFLSGEQFHSTNGWAADAGGYFGWALNLTPERTYKIILIPLVGYSGQFERIRAKLPYHLSWYGPFLGAGFQIEPGGRLVFNGGYSYHWLNLRFKTNPFHANGSGNLGQTGWAEMDYLISKLWRIGLGAQMHYDSTELLPTKLGTLEQKLKIRWTSLSGWFMLSRVLY